MDVDHPTVEAQDRLLLSLRALHGPALPALWCRACTRAGVVATGQLSAAELDRVCDALLQEGRGDAVAARTCRIRLLCARTRSAAPAPALRDDDVRRAFAQDGALAPDAWARRLAELEAELASA